MRQILYLDALVVDVHVSNCSIRANAWDSILIAKVIKKDLKSPSVFDKLQVSKHFLTFFCFEYTSHFFTCIDLFC